jgi:plastocyanin
MKRLLPLLVPAAALFSVSLCAAQVTGSVGFMTKRGQRPVVEETLVWLEPAPSARVVRRPGENAQMTTRNKALLPHIMAIPVGSTVTFPNEDPISHNLFSLSSGHSFDLGLYRRGAGKTEKFDSPGTVNVYCNVHPNMSAVIRVMSTPYYGFADANGRYAFDVPPGRYRVVAWNEQGGTAESTIEVGAAGAGAPVALTIDSRNFRVAGHLNKVGKPYQAPSTKDY